MRSDAGSVVTVMSLVPPDSAVERRIVAKDRRFNRADGDSIVEIPAKNLVDNPRRARTVTEREG